MNRSELPRLDFVVIGVNAEATLSACLVSILRTDYPEDLKRIYYVDGGSSDGSRELALKFPGVVVIELGLTHPTPGAGRNAGWRAGGAPMVFFLDSDTEVAPGFPRQAIGAFDQSVGAVQGKRLEKNPRGSVYNWIGDQEWQGSAGPAREFGGDVVVRREALEATGGYDAELIAGEDPELSQRLQKLGWGITRLDCLMTLHDLAMTRLAQYWRRAFRSGYAYASVRRLHGESDFWQVEARRIRVRGGLSLSFLLVGLVMGLMGQVLIASCCFLIALVLLFFPLIFRLGYFRRAKKLGLEAALIYAVHCSVVVIPQWFGMVRFELGRMLGAPLRNQPAALKTGTGL